MSSKSSKGIPRRTLEEFIFMYEREPQLIDLFVEGRADKVFLEHILNDISLNLRVWEVDDVEMPRELVEAEGEDVGARGRVVALAGQLESSLPKERSFSILCIIDADFDYAVQGARAAENRFLRRTDFSCIESYYWDDSSLKKYLRLWLHNSVPFDSTQFMGRVEPIMREVFLIRAAVVALGLRFHWIDPASCCSDARKGGGFDRGKYLERLLGRNSAFLLRDEIEHKVDELRESMDGDIRQNIHGHDLCKIIAWIVKPYLREGALYAEESISRSLACCVDPSRVVQYPLFVAISSLFQPHRA